MKREQKFNDTKKAPDTNQEQHIDRSNFSTGSLQTKTEGSTTPVVSKDTTFERSVTSRPTLSYHLLQFSSQGVPVSKKTTYNVANDKLLRKIN